MPPHVAPAGPGATPAPAGAASAGAVLPAAEVEELGAPSGAAVVLGTAASAELLGCAASGVCEQATPSTPNHAGQLFDRSNMRDIFFTVSVARQCARETVDYIRRSL